MRQFAKKVSSIIFSVLFLFSLFTGCKAENNEKLNTLFSLMYNCPNEELIEASIKGAYHIGEGVEDFEEPEDYVCPFFEDYVSEEYMDNFQAGFALFPNMIVGDKGISELTELKLEPKDSRTDFTLLVSCEKGETKEAIEITGSLRVDENGKLENMKYHTGYEAFTSFYQ